MARFIPPGPESLYPYDLHSSDVYGPCLSNRNHMLLQGFDGALREPNSLVDTWEFQHPHRADPLATCLLVQYHANQ